MKLRIPGTAFEGDVANPPSELPRGVRAAREGSSVWVHAAGETWRVEKADARHGAKGPEVEHELTAPMPGRVTKVFVEAGAAVAKGTALVVLEAMKMEHEIRAPKDGIVAKVFRKAGEMVAMGDPLVELD